MSVKESETMESGASDPSMDETQKSCDSIIEDVEMKVTTEKHQQVVDVGVVQIAREGGGSPTLFQARSLNIAESSLRARLEEILTAESDN